MEIFPLPSPLSYPELELSEAVLQGFAFAASPPARGVFLGKQFEVCANQSGQGSILLNRDFANLLDQFVIKGQVNIQIAIIRETLIMGP